MEGQIFTIHCRMGDKVSRFEREMDFGRQKHFMATFIIVDRIGPRSRIVELAKKIDGTIIQMSMASWLKVLAEKLGHVLGFRHALQNMAPKDIEPYIKASLAKIKIEEFSSQCPSLPIHHCP